MTPPPVSKEERQEQIINAAIACFSRKGYHLTTMDDIVTESGLSKGSLYWHFKNKKDVLISAMKWYFDTLASTLLPIIDGIPTVVQQLDILFDLFNQVLASDEPILRVFIDFYAQSRHDVEFEQALHQMMNPYIDVIGQHIQRGVDRGELKPVGARQFAVSVMAAYDGMFLYAMMLGHDAFDWQAIGRQFARIIMAGLVAEEAAS